MTRQTSGSPLREALPGHLHGFAQRHLLCLVHSQPLKEGEDQHLRTSGLGIPAPADEGQPVQKPSAAVEGQVHVGEIRKLALPGGHDAVEGTEDRDGEASVGQPVLPAAAHVDALAGRSASHFCSWQTRSGSRGLAA